MQHVFRQPAARQRVEESRGGGYPTHWAFLQAAVHKTAQAARRPRPWCRRSPDILGLAHELRREFRRDRADVVLI
ncbi:MAG TPA: hypothetical protein VLI21_07835, partial [Casimicrobiaceae bacterium]|nr:hypothetical protein [Casimicrobiaceae bacterium]